ncbi:UNVERIFIED_CONTAM: hypothetical protein PYX00_010815 [Menopon gallinae]|uniref:Phosphoglycerate mutase n=1 Tax=Menopon gallinae TaxID=328185 RepID=A0AAW2H6U8_9NEOP
MKYKLVLVRHGESEWNKTNQFTGWRNVDLSAKGVEEAHEAGKILKKEGYSFDVAFSSVLKRANRTLEIILKELNEEDLLTYKSWHLNERHYGALQGLDKAETAKKYGDEQVKIWRRSYNIMPPKAEEQDSLNNPALDPLYANLSQEEKKQLPLQESLKETVERVLPFWKDNIAPIIREGKRVIIVAHGNSLRALIMYLDNMSQEAIMELNLPTGTPWVYELDENLKPIRHYYLGDPQAIAAKEAAVANQGKAK